MDITPIVDPQRDKTMLRVYSGGSKGATSFFRNRPLLRLLMRRLAAYPGRRITVLFHASSIGAEPYSFAMYCRMHGLAATRDLDIRATDIDPHFLEFAREARYSESILATMTDAEREQFEIGDGWVRPVAAVRAMVHVLPPVSFVDAVFDEAFDVVFVTNAITYVSPADQTIALANIARYNRGYLVASAFHPDSIERDLRHTGYVPVQDDIEAIHESWDERRRDEPVAPGSPEYSWVLPRFSRIEGYEYRYCALFRRSDLVVDDEHDVVGGMH
ncbi:MAG: CheR family methyltransferase [Acidobacteriota bacterium]